MIKRFFAVILLCFCCINISFAQVEAAQDDIQTKAVVEKSDIPDEMDSQSDVVIEQFDIPDEYTPEIKKNKKRTVRIFTMKEDVTEIVDMWANENGFVPIMTMDGSLKYKTGNGVSGPYTFVDVKQSGDKVQLESWIAVPTITRINSLFILPDEMHINSGGIRAVLPRKVSRNKVNKLLIMLGQDPIK